MAISGVSKNYSGRKVDISMYPEIAVSGVPVEAKLAVNPRAIAGPSKIAQNYARILLTPLGSYRSVPSLGSNLLSQIRGGSFLRYPADISRVFATESFRVTDYLKSIETAGMPDDERIGQVSLRSYAINQGTISFLVDFKTRSNVSTSFLLPVAWNT